MNFIWAGLVGVSFVCAVICGRVGELSDSIMEGAKESVELIISILGVLCFWSGMMEIAKRSGITKGLAKIFSPLLAKLFPDVQRNSPAMHYISLNISANLLGLGNAATPFGLRAMRELQSVNPLRDTASDSMVLFVVMNTASLQLIPTTLCAYRGEYGAENPFDILLPVWVTSAVALAAGIVAAKSKRGVR